MRMRRVLAAGLGLVLSAGATLASATAASASDGPVTFYYGTDSWPVSGTGSAPYTEPHTGGAYGGYMGMSGNWAHRLGCSTGNFLAWSSANASQATTNYTKYHIGVGTGVYWYMGGPGVDPHWNGTTSEAYSWGATQASWLLSNLKTTHVDYPVVWADIELPGIAPAPDNGWDSAYTSSCSGKVRQSYVPVAVDRADFNGFYDYVTAHSSYKVGVYSSAQVWTRIFGTGAESKIPNTYEWTYLPETSSVTEGSSPYGWCLTRGKGACATFFGGQTSGDSHALMWQWSGGGGVSNGYGDFDQIDSGRMR